jgi:hypothetical protein
MYMSYRPNEPFVPKQQRKQYVSAVYCDKNLEQRINIEFCVQTGKCASEMLALSTLGYGEYAKKKLSVSEWHGRIKGGQEDVQGNPRSGQPKSQRMDAKVGRVRTLV